MALGVTVDFNANLVKFSGQMDKMAGQLDKFQRHAETMSSRVNSALAGLGVGLSASGLLTFVKSGIDAADALNDLADRSGIAIEKLAGLEYAVKIGDTSMEAFVAASNKLSINIAKSGEDFERLGITAKDPVETFKQLADVFSAIEDPQQRAALGAATMGKSYAEMAPLLMQGADGIQALIDKGREQNPITAEQARLAGEFNDKLDEMSGQSMGFKVNFAIGVLEPLAYLAEAIDKDIQKLGVFEGVIKGFFDGYKNFSMAGTGGGLSKELDDLNRSIAEKKLALSSAKKDETFIGEGREVGLQRELNKLLDERVSLEKKISDSRREKPDSAKSPSSDNQKVAEFISKSNDAEKAAKAHADAIKKAGDEEARRSATIQKLAENLRFEISLTGQSAETQRLLTDIRNATADATVAESASLEKLIKTKYDLIEADEILAAGEKLAAQQRSDAAGEFDRLNQKFNGALLDLNGNIADALQARADGIIPDDAKLKSILDKMGRDYNGLSESAGDAFDQMSVYAEQAGKDSQQALAEFLFDPFNAETGGMVDNFLTAIRRMASEAAAANLAELLFGGGPTMKDSNGVLREVVGWIGSAVGSYFGGAGSSGVDAFGANASGRIVSGVFANGGIMTDMGPLPLNKYALGGVANTPQVALFGEGRQPEAYVPLPDGRSIPVSMKDGGRQNVNYITMHITTPNADSFRKSERQIKQQMQRAINV